MTGAVLLLVAGAPLIAPYPGDATGATNLAVRFTPPAPQYLFGTDQLGRDVFSRVLFGGQTSLLIGFGSMLLAAAVGSALGLLAGYGGGVLDDILMRSADVFLGIPPLVLAILVALTLGGGAEMVVLAIAISHWPRLARLVRSEVLRLRVLEFIEAAVSYGASPTRIVVRHIFPGTLPVLVAQATLLAGHAILVAAALSFIGLGPKPPSAEWGLTIATGREYLPEFWWISFFPGAMIMITVIGLNLLGDAMREAMDPRYER